MLCKNPEAPASLPTPNIRVRAHENAPTGDPRLGSVLSSATGSRLILALLAGRRGLGMRSEAWEAGSAGSGGCAVSKGEARAGERCQRQRALARGRRRRCSAKLSEAP